MTPTCKTKIPFHFSVQQYPYILGKSYTLKLLSSITQGEVGSQSIIKLESLKGFNFTTVEPRYNEDLGTMTITLLLQVSHYVRVKKQGNIKSWDQQNYLVI